MHGLQFTSFSLKETDYLTVSPLTQDPELSKQGPELQLTYSGQISAEVRTKALFGETTEPWRLLLKQ